LSKIQGSGEGERREGRRREEGRKKEEGGEKEDKEENFEWYGYIHIPTLVNSPTIGICKFNNNLG
jgi:hypothetical protein